MRELLEVDATGLIGESRKGYGGRVGVVHALVADCASAARPHGDEPPAATLSWVGPTLDVTLSVNVRHLADTRLCFSWLISDCF